MRRPLLAFADLGSSRLARAGHLGPERRLPDLPENLTAPNGSTLAVIRAALSAAGVEFIPENGGGAGGDSA